MFHDGKKKDQDFTQKCLDRFLVTKKLKCFQNGINFEENFGDVWTGVVIPENVHIFLDFEIAAYSPLVDDVIFLRFYWGGFVCYVNSGAHVPPKYLLAKSWQIVYEGKPWDFVKLKGTKDTAKAMWQALIL